LLEKIIKEKITVVLSDFLFHELRTSPLYNEIESVLRMLYILGLTETVNLSKEDRKKARIIANRLGIPLGDVLHATAAEKAGAPIVTRDKHFLRLIDRVEVKRPEDLI
jgi:predicted nucleic acid-binding protein